MAFGAEVLNNLVYGPSGLESDSIFKHHAYKTSPINRGEFLLDCISEALGSSMFCCPTGPM